MAFPCWSTWRRICHASDTSSLVPKLCGHPLSCNAPYTSCTRQCFQPSERRLAGRIDWCSEPCSEDDGWHFGQAYGQASVVAQTISRTSYLKLNPQKCQSIITVMRYCTCGL